MTIADIANSIKNLFDISRSPAPTIPPMLMAIGSLQKPGMSAKLSVGNITKELAKHGIPTSPAEDGTENMVVRLVVSIVTEIYRAIREDANIQVAHMPGAIQILTAGANAGGPMISQGFNINFSQGQATIQ